MVKISQKLKVKSDIVLEIAKKKQLPLSTVSLFVDTVFDEITKALLNNQKVELRGFGSFGVKTYTAYKGRNPKSQEKVTVRAKKRPWFKPGQIQNHLQKK